MNRELNDVKVVQRISEKLRMKKIYVSAIGVPSVPVKVTRSNGKSEIITIPAKAPYLTTDIEIQEAAGLNPYVKISDPNAVEMLRHITERSDFPTVDVNMTSGDRRIKIFQYKADLEDLMRIELEKNGYEIEKSCEDISVKRFNDDDIIRYLEFQGHKVIRSEKKKIVGIKCKCGARAIITGERIYKCDVCKKEYGAVWTGAKFIYGVLTDELRQRIQKQIAEANLVADVGAADHDVNSDNPMPEVNDTPVSEIKNGSQTIDLSDKSEPIVSGSDIPAVPLQEQDEDTNADAFDLLKNSEPKTEPQKVSEVKHNVHPLNPEMFDSAAKTKQPIVKTSDKHKKKTIEKNGTKKHINLGNKIGEEDPEGDNMLKEADLDKQSVGKEHDFETGDPFNI